MFLLYGADYEGIIYCIVTGEEIHMDINVKCPFCHGVTGYDCKKPFAFCMQCGKKIILKSIPVGTAPVTTVNYPTPAQSFNGTPNLVISFESENLNVFLISTLLENGVNYQYSHGQSMGFNLMPGVHPIDLKIGKRTYRRDIVIYPNTDPVRVFCSWARGTARIIIANPAGIAPVIYY